MTCFDILNIEYNEEGYLLDFGLPDTMRICVKEGDNWSHTEEAIRKQINNIEELYANDVKVVDFTAFYEGTDKPLRGNYEDYDTHGEYAFMQAETFDVEFNDWANQEMMTHGKDISFKDWAEDEGMKHGNVPITEWAQHEEESHDARYGAESETVTSLPKDYIPTQKELDELNEAWENGDLHFCDESITHDEENGIYLCDECGREGDDMVFIDTYYDNFNMKKKPSMSLEYDTEEETEGARCMRRLDEMIDSMQEYADEYLARHPVDGYLPSDDHHDYTEVADGMVKDTTDAQQMAAEIVLRAMDLRDMADDLGSNMEYDAEEEEEEEMWEDEDYYNIEGEDYWDRIEGMYEDFCEDWEDNPDNDGQDCPSMDEWVDTYGNFDAESFEDFKRKMVGDGAVAGDVGYMEALEEFYEDYLEDFERITDEFCPEPETFEEFQERVLKNDYEMSLEAEDWGGDPKGKLATALRKAREKAKKPQKPLKIEKLDAETSGQWEIGEQLEEAQMNAEGKKRKKLSGQLSDPFDELSLDSGDWKGIVAGFGVGLLALFGYSKLRK